MCGEFITHGMLPSGHASRQHISHFLKPLVVGLSGKDEEDEEDRPVDGNDVLAHVVLAQTRGM